MTMTMHNYRPRQFHITLTGENPSSSNRDMGSESLAAARPPRQYPSSPEDLGNKGCLISNYFCTIPEPRDQRTSRRYAAGRSNPWSWNKSHSEKQGQLYFKGEKKSAKKVPGGCIASYHWWCNVYNKNTLWLHDIVRQTFRGKSAAAAPPAGQPRALTSGGMSAWPYRATTKFSFYPVQTYIS